MKILCPACGQEVGAKDVDLLQRLAKCVGCNNVFSFGDKVEGSVFSSLERPNIEMPKRFEISNGPEGFVIRRKWLGPEIYFLFFFCLAWNGFMIFFISLARTFSFIMIPHLTVGIVVAYAALAHLFNTTTITILYDAISLRHAPVPVLGGKTIARGDIQQLYSKETVSHGKHNDTYTYGVNVILNGGGDIELIGGFQGKEDAIFIEQQIEKRLGISDVIVPGELPR